MSGLFLKDSDNKINTQTKCTSNSHKLVHTRVSIDAMEKDDVGQMFLFIH